jgi:uridine kinase
MSEVYILGVTGGSGSGKTYFAHALAERLGLERACILYQDNYYIDQSEKFDHDGGAVNFDHPDALDFNLMAQQLSELKRLQSINIPTYDFATHKRNSETIKQAAKKVIIVDGILILGQPKLRELFTESVFVQTPENVRYERRLERDVKERGRTPEGVEAQFEAQVKPMHDTFVEPSKEYATYINSGTDMNEFYGLLERIEQKINSII